jgi:hypothetical protein
MFKPIVLASLFIVLSFLSAASASHDGGHVQKRGFSHDGAQAVLSHLTSTQYSSRRGAWWKCSDANTAALLSDCQDIVSIVRSLGEGINLAPFVCSNWIVGTCKARICGLGHELITLPGSLVAERLQFALLCVYAGKNGVAGDSPSLESKDGTWRLSLAACDEMTC